MIFLGLAPSGRSFVVGSTLRVTLKVLLVSVFSALTVPVSVPYSLQNAEAEATFTGGDVVRAARAYDGVPYRSTVCDRAAGMDCDCFVRFAFRDVGNPMPLGIRNQAEQGVRIDWANRRAGDVLFMDLVKNLDAGKADHVAIWTRDGYIIDASSYYERVTEHDFSNMYTRGDVMQVRRYR
jgi:cell wall-associated NlpC family hydrolase